jgi:hypothetical protein
MNSSFDTTPFLSWSIKRTSFSTSLAPADQVRLLTAKADVDAITAATSPEIIAIFENFDMVLSSERHFHLECSGTAETRRLYPPLFM